MGSYSVNFIAFPTFNFPCVSELKIVSGVVCWHANLINQEACVNVVMVPLATILMSLGNLSFVFSKVSLWQHRYRIPEKDTSSNGCGKVPI